MSVTGRSKALTLPEIGARKSRIPLVCLTAYTTPIARLVDPHCDIVLVGDSVGMVLHGLPSTLGVTLEMMILHGKAVRRGLERALALNPSRQACRPPTSPAFRRHWRSR